MNKKIKFLLFFFCSLSYLSSLNASLSRKKLFQDTLDRQLLEAVKLDNVHKASNLLAAGANPDARYESPNQIKMSVRSNAMQDLFDQYTKKSQPTKKRAVSFVDHQQDYTCTVQ